jgi:hypothetical protein
VRRIKIVVWISGKERSLAGIFSSWAYLNGMPEKDFTEIIAERKAKGCTIVKT